ncbi:MAG: amphi-Trp domain-containing protein [Thermodesulfobacteriota bacterium]
MDKKDACAPPNEGKFSYESVQDAKTLVEYLRALTDGFEKGTMRFSRKDMELALSPKGLIGFAVEAKAKDGRMKLALKFAWREAVEEKEPESDTFVITPGGEG